MNIGELSRARHRHLPGHPERARRALLRDHVEHRAVRRARRGHVRGDSSSTSSASSAWTCSSSSTRSSSSPRSPPCSAVRTGSTRAVRDPARRGRWKARPLARARRSLVRDRLHHQGPAQRELRRDRVGESRDTLLPAIDVLPERSGRRSTTLATGAPCCRGHRTSTSRCASCRIRRRAGPAPVRRARDQPEGCAAQHRDPTLRLEPARSRQRLPDRAASASTARTSPRPRRTEQFAPAQFFEMDDAAKLSRPSFARYDAGIVIGADTAPQTDFRREPRRAVRGDLPARAPSGAPLLQAGDDAVPGVCTRRLGSAVVALARSARAVRRSPPSTSRWRPKPTPSSARWT